MKKKRWLALAAAAALVSAQFSTGVYAGEEAEKLWISPDYAEAEINGEWTQVDGRTWDGSVENTEGNPAVDLIDVPEDIANGDFTITGDIVSNNNDLYSTATGVEATVATGGSSQSVGLTVEGDVSASVTDTGSGSNSAVGVAVNSFERNQQDETVTINIKGDVTAENSGQGYNAGATGVSVTTGPEAVLRTSSEGSSVTMDIKTGTVSATSKEYTAFGIHVNEREGSNGGGKINITTSGGVSATAENSYAGGVYIGNYERKSDVDITVGGDVSAEGQQALGVYSVAAQGKTDITVEGSVGAKGKDQARGVYNNGACGQNTQRILVTENVTASIDENGMDSANAITAGTDSVILVGGNATASGPKSTGILIQLSPYFGEEESRDGSTAGTEPGRIEVLGTVDGGSGENGSDLSVYIPTDWLFPQTDDSDGTGADSSSADDQMLEKIAESLPTVITHELKNGSIVVRTNDNADEKIKTAVKNALADKTFYTVNYTTKVKDATGKEDNSLGTIEITRYDDGFTELASEELQANGKTAYVAKAGDKIRINVRVNKAGTSENKSETVTGEAVVITEETDTEIITTKITPVTKRSWTEATSYELDLDKLKIADTLGYDATVKLIKETSTTGEVTWSLEVTPVGSIDLDIEAIIKAITEQSNLVEVTENIVEVERKAKANPVDPQQPDINPVDPRQPEILPVAAVQLESAASPDNTGIRTAGIDGHWVLVDAEANQWAFELNDGSRITGRWVYIVTPDGQNGPAKEGWFRFGSDGIMVLGWFDDGEESYWLDLQDGHMVTGWAEIDEKNYYFNTDPTFDPGSKIPGAKPFGAMFRDQNTPDNVWVGADGSRA